MKIAMNTVVDSIQQDLLRLAREELIPMSSTCTKEFIENPDGVEQHHPKWHQFGILTHSLKSLELLEEVVFPEVERFGKGLFIKNYLSYVIDGVSKEDLFKIALLWHDVGKWAGRTLDNDGIWDFKDHESLSERIILNLGLGKRYGLTDQQQAYVATLAGLHYLIGPGIRQIMRSTNLSIVPSKELFEVCRKIMMYHRDYYTEISLMFFADTISKGHTGHPEQKRQIKYSWEAFRICLSLLEEYDG